MNIFVVNSGSSSIKYQLFKMPSNTPVCSGLIERIGSDNSSFTHRVFSNGAETVLKKVMKIGTHEAGLLEVTRLLTDSETGVISHPSEINIVGHRVVHGGEMFIETTIVTPQVKAEIKKLFTLAPLHNPANYQGIEVAEKIFTSAKQVAVFDTAFHHTLPGKAFRFAIPGWLYNEHKVRTYGFHGTSHKYVSERASDFINNPAAKIITIHLGNGCSMAAISAGKSIDTSMGFGPLSGLIMGTRAGDIDASVIFHLVDELGQSIHQVRDLLNKQSGMLGLTGFSDMRDIKKAIDAGDSQAELAYEMYAYRIKKYIGAYAAILNGLDAIVFTAGVGENDQNIRMRVCAEMNYLGIILNEEKNSHLQPGINEISSEDSLVKVLVVPTNEELEIAQQCYDLITTAA